jgi:hypothetical protein
MPRVSSDYNLEVVHLALAGQWHPTPNGSPTPRDVIPLFHKLIWWLCPKGMNGGPESISGTVRRGFLCVSRKRRA